MSTEKVSNEPSDGFWTVIKGIRDQWLLIAFVASTLFWARDHVVELTRIPEHIAAQTERLDDLEAKVSRLGDGAPNETAGIPVLKFPGARHTVEDGAPGSAVRVTLDPVIWLRDGCIAGDLAAFMVDAQGLWHSVEIDIDQLPRVEASTPLSFSLQVHPYMNPGRARLLIQVALECGAERRREYTPWLHFRVLAP